MVKVMNRPLAVALTDMNRRQFLQSTLAALAAAGLPASVRANEAVRVVELGDSQLMLLSDGHMQLPLSLILPDSIGQSERVALMEQYQLDTQTIRQPCTITLWKTPERTILFDAGGGTLFLPTLGNLIDALASVDIEPGDITDVVFTHAHPDHLWGLIDDFDELSFPEANYYMNTEEWDYWRADDTMGKTPEARQSFVVGAQNRLVFLEERIQLFRWGDEVLPGLEAMDTSGHTPGHTSFVLHQGPESIVVLGDALSHPVFSFRQPSWPSGSDQNAEQGIATRMALLDRAATDKQPVVGFHLPDSGYGRVEKDGSAYRFVSETG